MTIEELIKRLTELQGETDRELAHLEADKLLLYFINNQDVSDAYSKNERWYA